MSQLCKRWGLTPFWTVNNILSWNVRGLNRRKKQLEEANFLGSNNIALFGLLETKVKGSNRGTLYQSLCPSWCFSHNMSNGRIIIGWRCEQIFVNILSCSSQFLHIEVQPLVGVSFLCTFIYVASTKKDRVDLFRSLDAMALGVTQPWLI